MKEPRLFEPAKIPGMIEACEQQMLFELAASNLAADGVIVEFGCFFGRSTACLINGVHSRWAQDRRTPAVIAYDSFGCADGAGFATHVRAFSKQYGVEHLVRNEGGRVDFYPVYRHFVGAAEDMGLLKTTVAELRDTVYVGGPIALMHIDAPKFYEELKVILFRFFPSLVVGGVVVFQDYFYHWSATLVAAVQALVEAGFLRLESSAASSAIARVVRAPSLAELLELDLCMARTPVTELIDRSLATVKIMNLDRPEQFVPRIHLAKVQHLWERGEFVLAQGAFINLMREAGNSLNGQVFNDFQELMRYGFSLRELYELDHA